MGAPGLSLKQQTAKNAKAAKKAALVSLESRSQDQNLSVFRLRYR